MAKYIKINLNELSLNYTWNILPLCDNGSLF